MESKRTGWLLSAVATIVLQSPAAGSCPIPLEREGTAWVVSVSINGEGPYRFLLDTGTSTTVVGAGLAARLHLELGQKSEARAADQVVEVREAVAGEVRLGTMILRQVPVVVLPLPRFDGQNRIDGVIGLDLFVQAPYLIDLRHRCLDPAADLSSLRGGTPLEAEVGGGRIVLQAHGADSRDLRFTLDSGASMLVLMSSRARALVAASGVIELTTASGRQRAPAGIVEVLAFGTLRLRDLPAVLLPASTARHEDGLFPIALFSTVFVDPRSNLVLVNAARK